MRFHIPDSSPYTLLRLAIKDACYGYESAANPEEADTIVTLDELQANILDQLDVVLGEKEKEFVTPDFLRAELRNNNLTETLFRTDEGIQEVWVFEKVNKQIIVES